MAEYDATAVHAAPPGFDRFEEPASQRGWWAPLVASRPSLGVEMPAVGEPLRVAFVGQRTYFLLCSQTAPNAVIEPHFIDHRDGADPEALRGELEALSPHVTVVFRPELIEAGLLATVPTITLGYLTEPLPRRGADEHPDLQRRLHELAKIDPAQFDRIVSFDPTVVQTAGRFAPIWRACPLPVDDRAFGWRTMAETPRAVFIGRSSTRRDGLLARAEHGRDLLHIEHGLFGEELLEVLHHRCDVAVNLHNEDYPTFENRMAVHLAAGNLVVSEPLSPSHGLEAASDFLEVTTSEDLDATLGRIAEDPAAFELTRARGRQKAEQFRASRVWARLLHDLLVDVAVLGRPDATH